MKTFYLAEGLEAGVDEVGRGCLAGPVVAAAVILPNDFFHPDLNDSKKLSPEKREKLREVICQQAIAYAVAEASVEEIDQFNILNASFLAMNRAITQLHRSPDRLLIDGNRFVNNSNIPHVCLVKGDATYASIAAASILAKNYRDELMKKLAQSYPSYGWEKNVGYPTAQHRKAIEKHGLSPYHRRTFKQLPLQPLLFMK